MTGDELIHYDYFVTSLSANTASLLLQVVVAGLVLLNIADDEFIGLCPFWLFGKGGFSGFDALLFHSLFLKVGALALKDAHLVGLEFRSLLYFQTPHLNVLVEGGKAIPDP